MANPKAQSPNPKSQRRAAEQLLLWGPVIAYMAAIFYLSAQSSPPVPSRVPDKLLHAIEYFGLGIVVFRAVAGGLSSAVDGTRARLTMLITVAYAVSDEVHQLFVPYRSADVRDLLADATGGAIALVVYQAWLIIRGSRS